MYEQERINPYGTGDKAEQVEAMFDNIAPTYDTINHRLSWDIDRYWRKKAIKELRRHLIEARASNSNPQKLKNSGTQILDIATGTGDFAILTAKMLRPTHRNPLLGKDLHIIGADISEGMMAIGRQKVEQAALADRISFQREDCCALSFADATFDAITASFGIRNFQSLDKGLREMCRVLRPGGMLCVVELTQPIHFPMRQLFKLYSHTIMPAYGRMISKDTSAYRYLTSSIEAFPQGEQMMQILQQAGFTNCRFKRMTGGICTMYLATTPS